MQEEFKTIPVDFLKPNELNPRSIDEISIEQLSRNIQEVGLLQNLVVTPNRERPGFYTIIVGEQRWRASQRNGERELPCRIIRDIKEEEQILMMLSENQLRKGFTATEVGKLVQRLESTGWTLLKVSERLGISQETLKSWVKFEKKATPRTKAALAPADSKRVPKGKIGTEAGQIITELPIPDEDKDRLVEVQRKERVPVRALGHLKDFAKDIPELETLAVFDKAKGIEVEQRIQAIGEGGKRHKQMIATAQMLLESNGFKTGVVVSLVGEKPDVVGVKDTELFLIEAETLSAIFKKRKPKVTGYAQSYILALPSELLGRFNQIWFIDGEVRQILCRIKGKHK